MFSPATAGKNFNKRPKSAMIRILIIYILICSYAKGQTPADSIFIRKNFITILSLSNDTITLSDYRRAIIFTEKLDTCYCQKYVIDTQNIKNGTFLLKYTNGKTAGVFSFKNSKLTGTAIKILNPVKNDIIITTYKKGRKHGYEYMIVNGGTVQITVYKRNKRINLISFFAPPYLN